MPGCIELPITQINRQNQSKNTSIKIEDNINEHRGKICRPTLFRAADHRRATTIATITTAAPPLDLAEGAEGEVTAASDPARPPGRLPPAAWS